MKDEKEEKKQPHSSIPFMAIVSVMSPPRQFIHIMRINTVTARGFPLFRWALVPDAAPTDWLAGCMA